MFDKQPTGSLGSTVMFIRSLRRACIVSENKTAFAPGHRRHPPGDAQVELVGRVTVPTSARPSFPRSERGVTQADAALRAQGCGGVDDGAATRGVHTRTP
jgi:hypothetical protein